MSNERTIPYLAQLIVALPGEDKQASLTISLAPADQVPTNGQTKPLADCTLAELSRFAETLQAEIWATYNDITLLALDEDKDVAVTVALLDAEGNAGDELGQWHSHFIILTEAEPPAIPEIVEPKPARRKKAAAEPKPEDATETEPPPGEDAAEAPVTVPEPKIVTPVSGQVETIPEDDVVAAIDVAETPAEDEEEEGVAMSAVPAIAPSEARVRVAGQQLPLGTYTSAAVDILMDEPALRSMQAHALSSLDREVAGVMIGPRPEKQPDGRYVVRIIDSIAAKYTVMQGASVTYTPDSWRYLNDTLMERYPDETAVMVGWYHTHPGFGIFLSGMDMFIHQNFFTQIWHIAYVLDPRARSSGFFCWNRDRTRVSRYDFAWPGWSAGSW